MAYSNKDVFTLSSVSVIICECLYNIVCIFVDTFLISRILTIVNYNIFQIGLFYLTQYSFQIFLSVILCYLLRKIKLNSFVTIGALIMMGLVMSVYFLSDADLITYLPLLALCYSLGSSCFWTGQNNLATVAVSSRYQVRFFTVKKTSVIAIKALAPILLGSAISAVGAEGFKTVAILMAVFTVLLFVFSLFVKANKKFNMTFKFGSYVKMMFKDRKKYKILWNDYFIGFFYGLGITTLSVLFTYMVFKHFQSDFYLGIVKTVITAVSLIGMFIFLKSYRKRQAIWYCSAPMIFVPIAGIVMLAWTNMWTILIFFFLFNALTVNLTSLTDMRRAGVIRLLDMHEHVLEHNAFFEVFLCAARILGFGLFMIMGTIDTTLMFNIGISVILVCFIVFCFLTYRMERLLVEQDKQWKKDHVVYNDKTATH